MAQITRPSKEGGATTYQAKVAAGYTKILASEVDADLDKIYSAWNAGVDGSNIQPGSITGVMLAPGAVGTRELADGGVKTDDIGAQQVTLAKLAPEVTTAGGDLSGSYPNPALGIVKGGAVQIQPRVQIVAGAADMSVQANATGSPGYDAAKPSYLLRHDYTGDESNIWRAPAGNPTGWAKLFAVKGDGKTYCTLADKSVALGALALGAAVQQFGFAGMATPVALGLNTELLCVEVLWTSRGGPWFAIAVLHGHLGATAAAPVTGVASNMRIDGTAGVPTDGAQVAAALLSGCTVATGTMIAPFSLSMAARGSALAAGSHRLKVTAWITGQVVGSAAADSGFILVGELA